MKTGLKNVAIRIENARTTFAETVLETLKINCEAPTMDEALRITDEFLKRKLATLDAVGGRITVKHGAYLEPEALANALDFIREEG